MAKTESNGRSIAQVQARIEVACQAAAVLLELILELATRRHEVRQTGAKAVQDALNRGTCRRCRAQAERCEQRIQTVGKVERTVRVQIQVLPEPDRRRVEDFFVRKVYTCNEIEPCAGVRCDPQILRKLLRVTKVARTYDNQW